MIPRIASIENLIASDPGGRNIFALAIADQLRLAAQSLRLARRVGIVSGFFIPGARAGETDGPSGAKVVGRALEQLDIDVDYITDRHNAPLFEAIGISPMVDAEEYLDACSPTHLLAIERPGRGEDGRYRSMNGVDITATTPPLDELFLQAARRGRTTIGIGDGGNKIGMGKVFAPTVGHPPSDVRRLVAVADTAAPAKPTTTVATDFCIASGVSNWGAYGLAGALSVLTQRDLLPQSAEMASDIERMVSDGGAVDGVTGKHEPTVDGLDLSHSVRMLEEIRRQIVPSPLAMGRSLRVAVLGYGLSGKAAVSLLAKRGHSVSVSDRRRVTIEPGITLAGIETGGHTIEFLKSHDLVIASPGVPGDAPIRNKLHRHGVPVMSELELAYQLSDHPIIAVTGTVGKRTTVELLERIFVLADCPLTIGGNRGEPFSALVGQDETPRTVALAVSSFQLETVVNFQPRIAIILNINEAHLDRHRSLAEYERIKSRIFMNQRPNDALILAYDDENVRSLARRRQGQTLFVSARQPVDRGAWLTGGKVYLNVGGDERELGPATTPFPENLLASLVAAELSGISSERLSNVLRQLAHPCARDDCAASEP
ncbi:MAG: glutamate cyclase domain-containing protein [Phycisphaerae bacterium]